MKNTFIQKDITIFKELLCSAFADEFPGIQEPIHKYFILMKKQMDCKGTHSMLLWAKRVYHTSLNNMLGQPSPGYPFLATKKGWPKQVLGLRKFSQTSEGRRAVLTVLSTFRVMIVPGNPDLSSITDEGLTVSPGLIDSIAKLVKPTELTDRIEYQFRSKSGPNGQAVRTASLDALALKNDPSLDRTLKDFLQLQDASHVVEDLESIQEVVSIEKPIFHSKLSYKYEAGGKVRIFAICDYYSQLALLPLHKTVARILRRMPQDFTWDQEAFATRVQEWRQKGFQSFWSVDLSSATDRFPAILQKKIVEKMIGGRFSELWYDLMTKRDFQSSEGKIRYQVGQPMGAYSSWPVFAFSHHMVVRYCSYKLGIKDPQYAIVGDDIVIADQRLAEMYINILSDLGVPTSPTKTLTGNCIEFCKRLWDESQEITPLPVKLLKQSKIDYRVLIQLNEWLYKRGCSEDLRDRLLNKLLPSNRRKKQLILLALTAPFITARWDGAPIREDWRWPPLSNDRLIEIVRMFRYDNLNKVLENVDKIFHDYVMEDVATGVPGLPADFQGYTASHRVLQLVEELVNQTKQSIDDFIDNTSLLFLDKPIPKSKVFDPQVLLPGNLIPPTREMSFLYKVWQEASEQYALKPKVKETPVVKDGDPYIPKKSFLDFVLGREPDGL